MPEISIIIPLYNKGKYIARAIESVFAQTFADFELIVVNDGSTDNGPEIINRYTDKRLRVLHQNNTGPGAARNRGIKESISPFLAFLDGDDELLPEFIEESLRKLKNNPDCDVTICSYYSGIDKVDFWKHYLFNFKFQERKWQVSADMKCEHLNQMMVSFYTCAFVCKRTAIEKYGGFYSLNNCNFGEDWYLWLQLIMNHKIYINTRPMAWYHREASELAPDGFTKKPFEPMFVDTEPIRKSCPCNYRNVLEQWLARHALQVAHLRAANGQSKDASYLSKLFPLMKLWKWEYFKLRTKIKFPTLIPFVRVIKQQICH